MKKLTAFLPACLCLAAGCDGSVAPGPPPPAAPVVLAELQVWHGLFNHVNAPYDSSDPAVIGRQIEKAKAMGIVGFVVDWYGPAGGAANDTERGFQDGATGTLLRQAAMRDFKIALLYDEGTIRSAETDPARYQARAESDLAAAAGYFSSPAYLRIRDKPALFVFPYDDVDPRIDWAAARQSLGVAVTLVDKDPNPIDPTPHDSCFDGFFAWVTATNGAWDPDGAEHGEEYLNWFYPTMQSPAYASKVTVGGVWPGFMDELAPWRDPAHPRYMSRQGTGTYDWLLALARRNEAPYIMLETWNDYEEGTDVEYGVAMAVDLDDDTTAVLPRSSPVRVDWSAEHVAPVLQVYKEGLADPIYDQPQTRGVWLALKSEGRYALKLWADDLPEPILRRVVVRGRDPVPGVTPVIVDE